MDYIESLYKTDTKVQSKVFKRKAKLKLINEAKQENLVRVLPKFEKGYSYHILCQDEWDSSSYVPFCQKKWKQPIKHLYVSTWVMSTDHIDMIFEMLNQGLIEQITIVMSGMFKRRNRVAYAQLLTKIEANPTKTKVAFFKNHTKITLMEFEDDWITIESSANFNKNPRLENYVATNNKELFEFHTSWINKIF